MTKIVKISIETTRRGSPALWEHGGGMTNTGNACVIAEADGSMPSAIYVNGERALIPIRVGMVVAEVRRHRDNYWIRVFEIESIDREGAEGATANLALLYEYEQGEWVPDDPPESLTAVIEAAVEKSRCYHCRCVHYAHTPARKF